MKVGSSSLYRQLHYFNDAIVEDTLRLGIKNKLIYFVLHSACCIFSACYASPEPLGRRPKGLKAN